MSEHSLFSASGAAGWMACAGKLALEQGRPDDESQYAAEGSAAHELAKWVLQARVDGLKTGKRVVATNYLGRVIELPRADGQGQWSFVVDEEMAAAVDAYADACMIWTRDHPGAVRLVEQRLNYAEALGVAPEQGFGTGDFVAVCPGEIQVHDFKYGKGVRVQAEGNEQMMLYALGAYYEHSLVEDFETVRMVIHQPRVADQPDEWVIGIDQLLAWADEAKAAAQKALEFVAEVAILGTDLHRAGALTPGEKQCRWCKAKAVCPALAAEVRGAVSASSGVKDFDDLSSADVQAVAAYGDNLLPVAMAKVDLIETWCKAVRAEVERRLFAGAAVEGWKLVEGKRGARRWLDAEAVKVRLKAMRLRDDEMYDWSLISPTTAEKILKKDSPRRWASLQEFIGQAQGKPSVAPASDARPPLAVSAVADDFADLTEPPGFAPGGAHPFRS